MPEIVSSGSKVVETFILLSTAFEFKEFSAVLAPAYSGL